jgi:hypothetical protein
MQKKEVTQADTATLSQWAKDLSGYFREDAPLKKRLLEIADRLEEQENKIGILEDALGESSTWASSLRNTIGKLQAEVDLLNKRPKR